MSISALSAMWFLPFAVPICLWITWNDLAHMKIPNQAVLALWAVFVVIGFFVLPLPEYGWRFVQIAAVLAIGFILNIAGAMGAGDAKFAAAMAPLVAPQDLRLILALLAILLVMSFVTHRVFKRIHAFRSLVPHWESWERRKFPMGFALGPTLAIYLAFGAVYGS